MKRINNQCYRIWLLAIPTFCIVLFLSSTKVRADGGAPNLAYVAGTAHSISIIDIGQQKITDTLPVSSKPDTILLSVDGRLLFVTQPEANRLSVIAPKTKQTICTQQIAGNPSLLTLDPGTDILYVAGNGSGIVTGIDPTTCHIVRTLRTSSGVYGLAIANVGNGISGGKIRSGWPEHQGSQSLMERATYKQHFPFQANHSTCVFLRARPFTLRHSREM